MPRVTVGPFSMEVSADWTLTTVILAGPVWPRSSSGKVRGSAQPKPFQSNIVATIEQVDADKTAERYVQRQIDGLKKANVPRWETNPPQIVMLPNGLEGLITEQQVEGPSGDIVRQLQLVTIKRESTKNEGPAYAYTLIATHLEGQAFEEMQDEFRAMLTSFR